MSAPLTCAVCGVVITTADADQLVATEAGPVHRECFEGPVASPLSAEDVLIDADEEEAARAEHGDAPLPYDAITTLPDGSRVVMELKTGADLPPDDGGDQAERYRALTGAPMRQPDYEGSERLADELERLDRQFGGDYDRDGYGY